MDESIVVNYNGKVHIASWFSAMNLVRHWVIVDSYNFLFRAFHVIPKLSNDDGVIINAVYGYIRMLLKYIEKFKDATFVVVADTGTKNFRHEAYPKYKANRPTIDPDLIPQFDIAAAAVKSINMPYLAVDGVEADDVIATLERRIHLEYPGSKVSIISSDKDLLQLVSERTVMFDASKDKAMTVSDVIAKMGVPPKQITDYLALTGDASDNIAGVKGVGPKTAVALLQASETIEEIVGKRDELARQHPKLAKYINLIGDDVLLFKRLITLKNDVDIDLTVLNSKPDYQGFRSFLERNKFQSVLPKLDEVFKERAETNLSAELIDAKQLVEGVMLGDGVLFALCVNDQEVNISDSSMKFAVISVSDFISVSINPAILKVTHNAILRATKGEINSFHDIMVMHYSATMTPASELDSLYSRYGSNSLPGLYKIATGKLVSEKAVAVYEYMDRPMVKILLGMQMHGMAVDPDILNQLTIEFKSEIQILEDKIYGLVGTEFNIGSTKQLSQIMRDTLGIALKKKSKKTGEYLTDVGVLEELSVQGGYEIADLVLEWRHFSKILNTYTQGFLKYINNDSRRIHTTYCIESTATGRMSSTNPNMQNIPVKSTEGRKIRRAFVAGEGCQLIAADYSQIELRLLAHMACENTLIEQINRGVDIHMLVASQIFNVPIADVMPDMRRMAKTVNFGIIYGISAFGLARQLKISQYEANRLIESYMKQYPGVVAYMESTKQFAREHGYVVTIFGRRCRTESISSTDYNMRKYAERAAINAPLQGSASDILKLAMIALDEFLRNNALQTKMSLQIHDEIILEAPYSEVDFVVSNMAAIMENVATLRVPLIANVSSGSNLMDL